MGGSHGKILIQQSPDNSELQQNNFNGCFCQPVTSKNGHHHNDRTVFTPGPIFEQAGESVKKPRLKLKNFFKLNTSEFQELSQPKFTSTPIREEGKKRKKAKKDNLVILMEDPMAIRHDPTAQQRKFSRDWSGFFRRKAAAEQKYMVPAAVAQDRSNHNSRTTHNAVSPARKMIKEHFDPRVTAKYDIKALVGKGKILKFI